MAEDLGVGTRGDFYDRTGALRDMVQNHALQLLTMIAMEPPPTGDADAHPRREAQGAEVAQALHARERGARRGARPVPRRTVDGQAVPGYLRRSEGAGRQPLRDLRRAAHRGAELALGRCALLPAHRQAPGRARRAASSSTSARCRTRSSPVPRGPTSWSSSCSPRTAWSCTCWPPRAAAPGELLVAGVARPGLRQGLSAERVGAYERLLLDAIAGRLNLFVRSDEQEQAWRWVEPVLEAWGNDASGPRPYAAGSWGPAASSALIARDGFAWAEEE